MNSFSVVIILLAIVLVVLASAILAPKIYARGLDLWLPSYLRLFRRWRVPRSDEDVHLLLCICDHYEPGHGAASPEVADERVARWVEDYPRVLGEFRDADGRPPRHTFFYPMEEYVESHLNALTHLCRAGFGEVEIHLHHDNETSESFRGRMESFREILDRRHGLLPHRRDTGESAYGFIHGNWTLDNSHPDGRWCGVNNELDLLRETGCYADFTLPSAPSRTQTRKINSIYYAIDDPIRPKSHNWGIDVGASITPDQALMLIQGPLVLSWRNPKWGFVPRIEDGCLQGNQPATIGRVDDWLRARIQIRSRPDWFFVKLHTHGAPESNRRVLIGESMVQFHKALALRSQENSRFHVHYVTAREMYNLVRAAEAGWQGSVADARDYDLKWDGCGPESAPLLSEKGKTA